MEVLMTPAVCLELYSQADDKLPEGFTVVYKGEWTQDYKTQLREVVLQHSATLRLFCIYESRSGSYHTDWYYDNPGCEEVTPKVVTTTIYVPI